MGAKKGSAYRWPQWLPDGLHVLCMQTDDIDSNSVRLVAISTTTGDEKVILENCMYARWLQPNYLLYIAEGHLFAQQFDLEQLTIQGKRQVLQNNVAVSVAEGAHFAVSQSGVLAFIKGPDHSGAAISRFYWVDSDSSQPPELASPYEGEVDDMNLSPDDRKVAFTEQGRVFVLDLKNGGNSVAWTSAGITNRVPIWAPDNKSIVYRSTRDKEHGVWIKNGPLEPERRLFYSHDTILVPHHFSPDGSTLLGYYERSDFTAGMWMHSMNAADSSVEYLTPDGSKSRYPVLSPDGVWLAYMEDRKIHIKPYGTISESMELTQGTVRSPRWSKRSNRIYYFDSGNLMKMDLSFAEGAPTPSQPTVFIQTTLELKSSARYFELDSEEKRALVLANESNQLLSQPPGDRNTVQLEFNLRAKLDQLFKDN